MCETSFAFFSISVVAVSWRGVRVWRGIRDGRKLPIIWAGYAFLSNKFIFFSHFIFFHINSIVRAIKQTAQRWHLSTVHGQAVSIIRWSAIAFPINGHRFLVPTASWRTLTLRMPGNIHMGFHTYLEGFMALI